MTISVRIVHLDHYMSTPGSLDRAYSPFCNQKLSKVPVIRIFGSTMAGQKICLHIHQVFPYFYVPYTIPAHYTTKEEIQKDIFQFGTSLNEAMDLAKPNDRNKNRHIAAIVLTKGVPFYGYHIGYTSFLKIYMTNPYEKQQMLDILQTKAIQNTAFQPYESHLNFELQFLLDHNLYGMDWIHIDDRHGILEGTESFGLRFRLPLLDEPKTNVHASQSSNSSSEFPDPQITTTYSPFPIYTSRTIPTQLQSTELSRESYCELELDITSMSILNRHDIKERNIHTTIKSEMAYLLQQRKSQSTEKLVKSLDAIWKDELKRRISRGLKDPSIPPVAENIDRNVTKEKWSTEVSLRKVLDKHMLSNETPNVDQTTQEPSILVPDMLTNFESVEALYPEAYFVFQAAQDGEDEEASIAPVTPISNQLNVSATPSRYRVWDLPSRLDTSALPSFLEDMSIQELAQEEEEQQQEDNDDEENFSLEDSLRNSDLASWLEETENKAQKRKHVVIEYENQSYQPRKLDFTEESQKMDEVMEMSTVSKNQDILDFEEEQEEEDESFQISNIPPESKPQMYKNYHHKGKNIDQLDGANDNKPREVKRPKTAEERWQEERKSLKRMRLRQQADKQQQKAKRTERSTSLPVIPKKPRTRLVPLRRVQSEKIKPEDQIQKVSIVIPRYVPEEKPSIWDIESTLPQKKSTFSPVSSFSDDIVETTIGTFDTKPSAPESIASSSFDTKKPTIHEDVEMIDSSSFDTKSLAPESIESSSFETKKPEDLEPIDSSSLDSKKPATQEQVERIDNSSFDTKHIPEPINSTNDQAISIDSTPPDLQIPVIHISSDESKEQRLDTVEALDFGGSNDFNTSITSSQDFQPVFSNDTDDFDYPMLPSPKHKFAPGTLSVIPTNDDAPEPSSRRVRKEQTVEPKPAPEPDPESQPRFIKDDVELIYNLPPPILTEKDVPNKGVIYQEPYYSNPSDVSRYPTVFAGKEFKLSSKGISSIPEFETTFHANQQAKTQIKKWTLYPNPPSIKQVQEWMKSEEFISIKKKRKESKSQLLNPTADNTFNFKFSATKPQVAGKKFRDHLDFFSLEIHVNTREDLLPDPKNDPVQLIFYCLQTEDRHIPSNGFQEGYYVGVIAMNDINITKIGISKRRLCIDYAETEEDLFRLLIERIRYYDPDMLVGYEVQSASWGYLIDRGVQIGYHLIDELSRFKMTSDVIKRDQWGYQKASVYKIIGRHMLNVWRLMRNELTFISYTLENVTYHLLHHRIPHYSHATLTSWYKQGSPNLRYRLFQYYMKRVQLNFDILDASQVIQRTCESARVYGIDFYAVITRGSQYDVESTMFRITKPENFCLISPSRLQVASQRSLECLPLIMEPVSQFYSSPMVVLDFQSLYPSIMIAYNYCYSTCLGRIRKPNDSSRFGILPSFELDSGILETFKDRINISPNGVVFVKPDVRKSTLAKMLAELLDTRVMVKRAMKDYKHDSGLLRLLDAKQLTLKLLANVTYGYTSASFSGRMPSVEIADSIVSTGRETLERAIHKINTTEKWGSRVVYGDTDSVFIYFPGKTRQEAFVLGQEIADTVTKMNPDPIKLKFEKVYHPTVLLAKKRYVGFKYESPNDTEPVFEAKGIETVRRDGTAATQKIMESSLKILFRTQDMSELKRYLMGEWTKILSNRVLLKEFIISKEVRMGTYSSRGGPNGAVVAQAGKDQDERAEPQYGERVPYVVVYRGPNAKLKDKVVRPSVLLNNSSLRLDAEYYIRKQIIPPLSRVFNLVGVDILSWYESMPRSVKVEAMSLAQESDQQAKNMTRIDQYYSSAHCIVCRKLTHKSICASCLRNRGNTIYTLMSRQQKAQQKFRHTLQTCQDCSKVNPLDAMFVIEGDQFADIPCDSLDCPIFYERLKAKKDVGITLKYDTLA